MYALSINENMTKGKNTISLLGFNKNLEGMLTSYCLLLKPQLKEHWIINRTDGNSEVIIVSNEYKGSISKVSKYKVVINNRSDLGNNTNDVSFSKVFNIDYPVKSSKIIKVLNSISKFQAVNKKGTANKNNKIFAFKNIFSTFKQHLLNRQIVKHLDKKHAKTQNVIHKLSKLLNHDLNKSLKVVFLGRPGSGKTTTVSIASSKPALSSEVNTTDSISLIKKHTTIGIDYSECTLVDDVKLRLYGTPGQKRYDYVQTQTVARADIYIILIDLSSMAPFAEFMYFKEIIEFAGNDDAIRLVAFTHFDVKQHGMSQLAKEIRHKYHGEILTHKLDVREKPEVTAMLSTLTQLSVQVSQDKHSIKQIYEDNNAF